MELLDNNNDLYSLSPDWADLVPIHALFNDREINLLSRVQLAAEHGAHVLYPRIEASEFESADLIFFVTLDTAIRINRSLMALADIAGTEVSFREELSATLLSKQRLTH